MVPFHNLLNLNNLFNNSDGFTYLSKDELTDLTNQMLESEFISSALQMYYQDKSNKDAMNFEARQAELNRIFQQSSAEKAMKFESEQAEINRTFQKESASAAMAFEEAQALKSMEFQERMANSSYQRAVEDLRKAGLNPILAYTNGGASTPSGAMATGKTSPGSSASGKQASGSSASGKSSSGSKANASSVASAVLSYSSNIVSNSAKLLNAVGSIIPG